MSEPLATISPVTGLGMIAIRADLAQSGAAIAAALGLPLPDQTRILHQGDSSLGWMSPDELLAMVPVAEAAQTVAALQEALAGHHALVLDVSDMRAVYDITGPKAWQALAKLCPVDFATLPEDGLRRTRAAQVAVGLWRREGGFRLMGFRSVADYMRVILTNAAIPGSDLDAR